MPFHRGSVAHRCASRSAAVVFASAMTFTVSMSRVVCQCLLSRAPVLKKSGTVCLI